MSRWVGRVALVTGASCGIGEAIARKLTKSGMKGVACSRSFEKLKKIQNDLASLAGSLHPFECDLTKTEETKRMFDWIQVNLGGVDICINNAAMNVSKGLLDAEPNEWRSMLELNVIGLSTCTSLSVGQMMSRGVDDGQIVHIGSLLCRRVIDGRYANFRFQAGVKHMISALTEGLRQELSEKNSHIRVALVSPSGVNTPLNDTLLMKKDIEGEPKKTPTKRIEPTEVANLVMTVIEQKPHVQIHEVFFRPTDQIE